MGFVIKRIEENCAYPKGVVLNKGILHICVELNNLKASAQVTLYNEHEDQLAVLDVADWNRLGNLCYAAFEVKGAKKMLYRITCDEEVLDDPYMRGFEGDNEFGYPVEPKKVYFTAKDSNFNWEDDSYPELDYNESVWYLLHARGFTRHSSSKVRGKGTFKGIVQKIDYLKDLGVTTLEMMPVMALKEPARRENDYRTNPKDKEAKKNYWGFQNAYYYCVNKHLCSNADADELKELVKALHSNNMELILQMYFPGEVRRGDIVDILSFYRSEFHIDGFHIKGDNIPKAIINEAPELKGAKLVFDYIDEYELISNIENEKITVASYTEDYMYDMRRFLKGDEGMCELALKHLRGYNKYKGLIRFFTNYYGFTLMDLVSYDRKHNEENGEENVDGNDYNLSWNCGVEGDTRKAAINTLRHKQIKNAMLMLLMGQGTPLLFMGDEFGNSQKGNNNPYGLDNEITWLNWNDCKKNADIFAFTKEALAFRKTHEYMHPAKGLRMMDYLSCGYPDLSYHGVEAWKADLCVYNRNVGLMYCGKYGGDDNKFVYMAINMHWEKHDFALPNMPEGLEFVCKFNTAGNNEEIKISQEGKMVLEPRSICILETQGTIKPPKTIKRKKKVNV